MRSMEAPEPLNCPSCAEVFDSSGGALVMCPRCGGQVVPRSPGAKLFLLDTNAYDPILADAGLCQAVIGACHAGAIELLMTHVQRDELAEMPDSDKRDRALTLPFVMVVTYGMVLGVSRLGLARLGEPEEFEEIRNFSPRHSKDALLAITAKREGAVFVTNERRLSNFARRAAIEVWSSSEFADFVRNHG